MSCLHDGHSVTELELIAHCRHSLAVFKAPTSIAFRQELPRTLVGKVLRRALQNEEAAKTGIEPQPLRPVSTGRWRDTMKDVVIIAGVRTPIGNFGGA